MKRILTRRQFVGATAASVFAITYRQNLQANPREALFREAQTLGHFRRHIQYSVSDKGASIVQTKDHRTPILKIGHSDLTWQWQGFVRSRQITRPIRLSQRCCSTLQAQPSALIIPGGHPFLSVMQSRLDRHRVIMVAPYLIRAHLVAIVSCRSTRAQEEQRDQ